MKVLVATKETQGKRKNDFCFTEEGELVKFGFECDRETVNGNCGCKRSLCGLSTSKGTTTFKVVDENITKEEYTKQIANALVRDGWYKTEKEALQTSNTESTELLRMASVFPAGTILEKRGNKIQKRQTEIEKQMAEVEIWKLEKRGSYGTTTEQ